MTTDHRAAKLKPTLPDSINFFGTAVPSIAISLQGVSVGYGNGATILHQINLNLSEGSFTFLEGNSGAGKSTFLRLLRMDLLPSAGQLQLFDKDVATISRNQRAALRRRLGLVFQDFRLVPWLSALENVTLPLRLSGENDSTARAHASELLSWVGLEKRQDTFPDRLSGGERQCVAIARAVISRPQFLLADEPTGSVDAQTAKRLLHLFFSLREGGTAVLLATHDNTLANRYECDRLVIENGRILPSPSHAAVPVSFAPHQEVAPPHPSVPPPISASA
ncbi:MAG: ATP-binding cassette domain-containing protein [Alphaproteobacteria bacterium]